MRGRKQIFSECRPLFSVRRGKPPLFWIILYRSTQPAAGDPCSLVCIVGPLPPDFPGIKPASAAFAAGCIHLAKHRKTVCKRPDARFGWGSWPYLLVNGAILSRFGSRLVSNAYSAASGRSSSEGRSGVQHSRRNFADDSAPALGRGSRRQEDARAASEEASPGQDEGGGRGAHEPRVDRASDRVGDLRDGGVR